MLWDAFCAVVWLVGHMGVLVEITMSSSNISIEIFSNTTQNPTFGS
jgi:hypothetical protein